MNASAPIAPTPGDEHCMRAIVHARYGPPDVLRCQALARPIPGPGQVLVQVAAAGVSIGDHHIVTGKPYIVRVTPFGGLPRPRHSVPGSAMAGRVAALGPGVTALRVGDEVFGETQHGAFAEYVVVAPRALAPKPTNLSFDEAAAAPWAITALQALRDAARLQPGQRVLVNGASGGVGTWAVQIAKALGAHVTAVCSTRNVARMHALGADVVIDYTREDFALGAGRYDVMLDAVANRSVAACRRVLTPRGTYVTCAGGASTLGWLGRLAVVVISSWFSRRTFKGFIAKPNQADLLAIKALVEAGHARPTLEQRYPLSDIALALSHVGAARSQGQTVVTMGATT